MGPRDLRPHHYWKKRKDASTDSGLGASAQTLVLRRIILSIALFFAIINSLDLLLWKNQCLTVFGVGGKNFLNQFRIRWLIFGFGGKNFLNRFRWLTFKFDFIGVGGKN